MLFLLTMVATAAIAFLLRRKPLWAVVVGLVMHSAVPSVLVVSRLQLARFSIHPGSWMMLWALVLMLVWHRERLWDFVAARVEFVVLLAGVVGSALVHALMVTGGPPALAFVVDQFLASAAAFVVVGACVGQERSREVIRWTILAVATATAAFAVMQQRANSILLFEDAFAQQDWMGSTDVRWMATFDHPLVLSLFLATATPLLATVRRQWLVLPLLGLFVAGVAAAESRLGVLVVLLAAAYVLLFGRKSFAVAVATWVAAAVGGILVLSAGLLAGVQERFQTADDSTLARVEAAAYFVEILPDHLWMGAGTGASYTIASEAGLASSFENSVFMMTLDIGLLTTLIYFGLLVACAVVGLRRGADASLVVALVISMVSMLSFSALGVRSVVAPLLWIVAAAAAFSPGTRPAPDRRRTRRSVPVARPTGPLEGTLS